MFGISQTHWLSIFSNAFFVKAFFLTRIIDFFTILPLKCDFYTVRMSFTDIKVANLLIIIVMSISVGFSSSNVVSTIVY